MLIIKKDFQNLTFNQIEDPIFITSNQLNYNVSILKSAAYFPLAFSLKET